MCSDFPLSPKYAALIIEFECHIMFQCCPMRCPHIRDFHVSSKEWMQIRFVVDIEFWHHQLYLIMRVHKLPANFYRLCSNNFFHWLSGFCIGQEPNQINTCVKTQFELKVWIVCDVCGICVYVCEWLSTRISIKSEQVLRPEASSWLKSARLLHVNRHQ